MSATLTFRIPPLFRIASWLHIAEPNLDNHGMMRPRFCNKLRSQLRECASEDHKANKTGQERRALTKGPLGNGTGVARIMLFGN